MYSDSVNEIAEVGSGYYRYRHRSGSIQWERLLAKDSRLLVGSVNGRPGWVNVVSRAGDVALIPLAKDSRSDEIQALFRQ